MLVTLIQAIIFLLFIFFLLVKFKRSLPSISESWYYLKYPTNLLFPLFSISIGILMPLHIVGDPVIFLLSSSGLIFTGVASMFKSNIVTRIIHAIGAITCVIGILSGLWINFSYWLPTVVFLLSSVIILLLRTKGVVKNYIWWIEIVAFISIFIGLMYIYL